MNMPFEEGYIFLQFEKIMLVLMCDLKAICVFYVDMMSAEDWK